MNELERKKYDAMVNVIDEWLSLEASGLYGSEYKVLYVQCKERARAALSAAKE